MKLSAHFSLEEMTFSAMALRQGIDNTPNAEQQENLQTLCIDVLEPVRYLLDCPLHIDSGFRSSRINQLVGSTAVHSDHLDGNAADFIPIGVSLQAAFDNIRASMIPFKRIIIECNAWIHIARQSDGGKPFREALLASGTPGHWTYEVVA